MPRWLIPALFAVALAAGSPVETLTGSLRSISSSELVLDSNDDRVIPVQIQSATKYLSTMDKVKASDFGPGDHVTVEATRDESGHYHSTSITMNKKGTAEDKELARQKASENSAPKPDKPAAPNPAAVQAANTAPSSSASSSDSTNPDRPRLKRATDAGGTSSAPVSPSPSSSSSSSSNSDSVPSATISPAAGRRSTAASTDDSSTPVLRRSAAATSDSSPTSATPAGRPSLSAEDVNGVTRPPVVPPAPGLGADGEPRGFGDEDPVIGQTREVASSFVQTLPNYIVKQFVTRYRAQSASGGHTSWQAQDVVTADLVYLDGKENYTNIMANGRPTKDASQTGSWSEGEFASSLLALLSPFSATEFRNKRSVTIVNRPAFKYDYSISQPRSAWRIETEGQSYQPAYDGSIWIDKETFRVLRIEMAARNMPRSFPIDTTESSLDYDFVLIGDQKYLLPVHSESLSCWRGTAQCARNVIDFRNYKKYTSDASITFEGAVPDK